MDLLHKCVLVILLVLSVTKSTYSQTQFDFTKAANRSQHDQFLKDSLITGSLKVPLSTATEKEWQKAFWAMELMLYKSKETSLKLSEAWRMANQLSEGFQKSLLEVSYSIDPGTFIRPATQLLHNTLSPAVFIRAAEYIWLADKTQSTKRMIHRLMRQKFKDANFIGFNLLQRRLNEPVQQRPSLKALFDSSFLAGQTIIYSLQRSNRDYAGLVLIRKPNGQFARNSDGSFFHTSQLARSISNYPFYITNGNTPQGLFRWAAFDSSTNNYIGPTTTLQLLMPYESTPSVFLPNNSTSEKMWTEEIYANLLPTSWRSYNGVYESFWAGAIDRSEIIMHGTTINPIYYKEQKYFPQTPSLGCLCSYEAWDKNGRLTNSHQEQIVRALKTIGSSNGYVVVVNLDNRNKVVELKEVMHLLK